MKTQIIVTLKRLVFYWAAGFVLAASLYYLLWLIMPGHYVFGALPRMFIYHWHHPLQYIMIPCFFYGIIATAVSASFYKKEVKGKILMTFQIILLTILLSSPFGGMLYFYHDMQAGYFPENWVSRMIMHGIGSGFQTGWLIIAISVPYNILGSVVCYFLTKKGSELFHTVSQK